MNIDADAIYIPSSVCFEAEYAWDVWKYACLIIVIVRMYRSVMCQKYRRYMCQKYHRYFSSSIIILISRNRKKGIFHPSISRLVVCISLLHLQFENVVARNFCNVVARASVKNSIILIMYRYCTHIPFHHTPQTHLK